MSGPTETQKPPGMNRWIVTAIALVVIIMAGIAFYYQAGKETVPAADALPVVRVGVLQYGTVNWELDTVKHHGLDAKEGVNIEVVPLASKNATAVALQGGAVDVIVTDWIWVSRQRASGLDYSFFPYSIAAGGIVVRPDSGIHQLADLRGRKIGIAGGPVDKSWLLLQAYARKTLDVNLSEIVEPVYGAPPLLNELILKNEISANLTFWNFEARLRAKGMQQLITIPEVIRALVSEPEVPVVGWVFSDSWAAKNPSAVKGLLKASQAAKKLLGDSDAEWERLRPSMEAADEAEFVALRDSFRDGIPKESPARDAKAAAEVFSVLVEFGGAELVGDERELSPGTFWNGPLD